MKAIWRWLLIKLLCEQGHHGWKNIIATEIPGGWHKSKCTRCHTIIMLSDTDYRHHYPDAWDVARGVDVDPFEAQS